MNEHRQPVDDWFPGGIPANVTIGRKVHIDSAHAFAACRSQRTPGVILGDCCGIYYPSTISVGPDGLLRIGEYTCVNGTYLDCCQDISIGAHCLLAWGVIITDHAPTGDTPLRARREALSHVAKRSDRTLQPVGQVWPVTVEDNVWIGFGAVVLPGVTLGRGSIVGCKSIVVESVPAYCVAVGNPARIVQHLDPTDTEHARRKALRECLLA
jgi:acetyltransferase-like isoleucine patch superfamily enzyme